MDDISVHDPFSYASSHSLIIGGSIGGQEVRTGTPEKF